jgi:hypothetical protein
VPQRVRRAEGLAEHLKSSRRGIRVRRVEVVDGHEATEAGRVGRDPVVAAEPDGLVAQVGDGDLPGQLQHEGQIGLVQVIRRRTHRRSLGRHP